MIDIDDRLAEDTISSGKMCPKCYSALDKYYTLHTSLVTNMNKAVHTIISTTTSATKRARLDIGGSVQGLLKDTVTVGTSGTSQHPSPDVTVSQNIYSLV